MKTHYLALVCFLAPLFVFSQEWKPYKIDDSVQVSLPPDFKILDTLGQTQITARSNFGFIQITKQPDNQHTTPDIEKLKHLNRYYNDFVKRIKTSSKFGIISDEKDILLQNLHVKDFTLTVDSGSGKQIRKFRILHENSATYSFQFLFKDISAEYALPESKLFFNSIKIPPGTDVESQFTEVGNTTGKKPPGSHTILYIEIAIGLLILIGIIFYLRKRRSG